MTTFCKPIGRLRFAALFDGRLQKFGVYQRVVEGKSTETHQSLTDGPTSYGSTDSRTTITCR